MINGHRSKVTILTDLCDGSVIAYNHLFSADPTVFQLFLYYYEFTVVNPLASKVKKYKVEAFYMTRKSTIKVQNSIKHINLFLLCKSFILKRNMASVPFYLFIYLFFFFLRLGLLHR